MKMDSLLLGYFLFHEVIASVTFGFWSDNSQNMQIIVFFENLTYQVRNLDRPILVQALHWLWMCLLWI